MATKTKDIIVNSFLNLANRDDIIAEKISITDIVDECEISRQTFYYHFKDIEEMLEWAFKNDTANIKAKMVKYDTWHDSLPLLEDLLNKYSTFLKKCLNSKNFVYVYSILNDCLFDYTKDFFVTKKNTRIDTKTEFLLSVYSYALIGFIIRELKKDNPDFNAMINEIIQNLSFPQSK